MGGEEGVGVEGEGEETMALLGAEPSAVEEGEAEPDNETAVEWLPDFGICSKMVVWLYV